MWSTRRLKLSSKGYSLVNKLPQSIYPQQIPDAVKERWVGKSLVKDGFYSMDLSGRQRMLTHSWVNWSPFISQTSDSFIVLLVDG